MELRDVVGLLVLHLHECGWLVGKTRSLGSMQGNRPGWSGSCLILLQMSSFLSDPSPSLCHRVKASLGFWPRPPESPHDGWGRTLPYLGSGPARPEEVLFREI